MQRMSYLQRFGDVELAVGSQGEGMPFIWGHSLMGSVRVENRAALWDWSSVDPYANIVRYDARGHGNSDGSYKSEDYRWDRMAADMLSIASFFCAPNGDSRCMLGGISMGAATALEAAVQRPDLVAGLVLALPPTAWKTRPRQAAVYRRMAWVSGLFGAAPYRLLDLLPIPMREDGRNQIAIHTMKGLAQANPLHVQAALRGAARSDLPEKGQLKQLHVPTLILAWEGDDAHPVSTATELYNNLPNVHDLVVCHPGDLSEWEPALVEFVQKVTSTHETRQPRTVRDTKSRKRKKPGPPRDGGVSRAINL